MHLFLILLQIGVDGGSKRILQNVKNLVNTVITKLMLHIFISSHRLFADHDIPPSIHNESDFSLFLSNLILQMLNSTTLHLNHIATQDCNSLAHCMRFVAPLFWVFQDHKEMNCYPFSVEQEYLIQINQSGKMDLKSWI